MSSTQQGLNKFKEAMEAFLFNFEVMRQSFDMLQMALNAMKDIDIEELDLYLTNDSTNESHPVMRQPAIATKVVYAKGCYWKLRFNQTPWLEYHKRFNQTYIINIHHKHTS